jgi:triosephosphate isomerase (TIM)
VRIPFVAGNWKMHKTVAETVAFVKEFRALVKDVSGIDIVLAPAFTSLHAAAEAARNSNVAISAQDVYWEKQGAFTGEISAAMIHETGAEYVIVGHSERRTLFGESDDSVRRKMQAAFDASLTPIVCVGETLAERDGNQTFAVLDRQLAQGLKGLAATRLSELVIAYEPVWAIGTGRNATPDQAAEAHGHIRQHLRASFGPDAAEAVRILYGGSVKPDNVSALAAQPDVDGALVGGASLDVQGFFDIVARIRAATV